MNELQRIGLEELVEKLREIEMQEHRPNYICISLNAFFRHKMYETSVMGYSSRWSVNMVGDTLGYLWSDWDKYSGHRYYPVVEEEKRTNEKDRRELAGFLADTIEEMMEDWK